MKLNTEVPAYTRALHVALTDISVNTHCEVVSKQKSKDALTWPVTRQDVELATGCCHAKNLNCFKSN